MVKKNQTIKGITFANLSYGAESHVQLDDIKLTLPQSEIYLHANNYKSVVFIGGRGAGKSFLGKKFLEDCLSSQTYSIVSIFGSNFTSECHKALEKTCDNYMIHHDWKVLGYIDPNRTILHLDEPFLYTGKDIEQFYHYQRFFVECTVPQLDKNNELHRWFIDLVSKDSTLTVIGNTCTNFQNLGTSLRQLVAGYSSNSVNIDGI